MKEILLAIKELDDKFTKRFDEINTKIDNLNIDLLEQTNFQHGDTIAILHKINKEIKTLNKDTDYLAEKIGKHEMILNREKH